MATSLLFKKHLIASPKAQLEILHTKAQEIDRITAQVGAVKMLRTTNVPEVLQINLGYMCNQVCDHCHVDAGPDRREIMDIATINLCLDAVTEFKIKTVDLTGGAPEMNPNFRYLITELVKRNVPDIIVRSNLTILVSHQKYADLPGFFAENKIHVISSLPCYTKENVDKQRGEGVFDKSISALKCLNDLGYGKADSGLKLDLVFNPGGPNIAGNQAVLESDYKERLQNDFGVIFNNLFTITNLPISRFLKYLLDNNRLEEYLLKLSQAFNPNTLEKLMCRNTLSVDWQGNLYDCDFNQMLNLPVTGNAKHISQFDQIAARNVVAAPHCLGCTAGAGSSCKGALT